MPDSDITKKLDPTRMQLREIDPKNGKQNEIAQRLHTQLKNKTITTIEER